MIHFQTTVPYNPGKASFDNSTFFDNNNQRPNPYFEKETGGKAAHVRKAHNKKNLTSAT
jgi:hypothetical protein